MELDLVMFPKLLLAAILGGLVGYEREVHDHPAGLRTHVLVCMGSALVTMVSMSFSELGGDPSRVASQIVSGMGFLGAGTILRQGNIVRGLTTAASLWTIAAIGMAVGVGGSMLILGVVAAGIVFVTLSVMRAIEIPLARRAPHHLHIEIAANRLESYGVLTRKLAELGVKIESVACSEVSQEGVCGYDLKLVLPDKVDSRQVGQMLVEAEGIKSFTWN